MIAKIFLIMFLLGLKSTVFGESIKSSINEFEELHCQLICETCVMNVRGIRWLLLQSYTRKIIAELLSILCNFFPYKQPRAQCKRFFKGPFDGLVHDFVVNMSVYEPCQYLGLCETVQEELMISPDDSFYTNLLMKTLSIVKEDIESIITPESIEQAAIKLCSSDNTNSDGEWFSDDF